MGYLSFEIVSNTLSALSECIYCIKIWYFNFVTLSLQVEILSQCTLFGDKEQHCGKACFDSILSDLIDHLNPTENRPLKQTLKQTPAGPQNMNTKPNYINNYY